MKETREGESLEILDVTSTLCVQSDLFLALLLLDSLSRIYPVRRILLAYLHAYSHGKWLLLYLLDY